MEWTINTWPPAGQREHRYFVDGIGTGFTKKIKVRWRTYLHVFQSYDPGNKLYRLRYFKTEERAKKWVEDQFQILILKSL